MTLREMIFKYGKRDADWLEERIHAFWEENAMRDPEGGDYFECVDNVRLVRTMDVVDTVAYEESVRTGCCGRHSETLGPSPAGFYYVYGFNFGH